MKIQPNKFGYTGSLPKFVTADEAAKTTGISAARLLELVAAGYAPHHCIDGGPPMFRTGEISSWVKENLIQSRGGLPLPKAAFVYPEPPPACFTAPACIRAVEQLQQCYFPDQVSGVYFLCCRDEVVYVGQSTDVITRVAQHRRLKEFDRAYYWPVPPEELDRVEGAFIRILRPRLNGNVGPVTDNETTARCKDVLRMTA